MTLLSYGSCEPFYDRTVKTPPPNQTCLRPSFRVFSKLLKLDSFFPLSVSFDRSPPTPCNWELLVRIYSYRTEKKKSLEICDQFNDKESQEPSATLGESRSQQKVEVPSLETCALSPCTAWCKMKASADSKRYNYHQGGGIIKVRIIYLKEDKN